MVKDTIQAVKEAEERAAEMIQKASVEGKALVNQAKSEASKMREEALGEAREKAGKIREKLAEEGADYLEKAVAAAEEDIASLKWNAGKKTEEVINKVISELI